MDWMHLPDLLLGPVLEPHPDTHVLSGEKRIVGGESRGIFPYLCPSTDTHSACLLVCVSGEQCGRSRDCVFLSTLVFQALAQYWACSWLSEL